MTKRLCLIGLDEPEYSQYGSRVPFPVLAHESVPHVIVTGGRLFVESRSGDRMLPVTQVVFHGIFEDDLDLITALALWGGPCIPSASAMMDCRLKLPCLVRALRHTRFAAPARGFVSAGTTTYVESPHVGKWGNWHCGENKARFDESWTAPEPAIVEPFFAGQSVRVAVIGERAWQIRLEGTDWLKSIHAPDAAFMPIDPELLDDTQNVLAALGLEIGAIDYIVGDDGRKHLLEVNHIPNVTRFPELWRSFLDYTATWAGGE
jgi:hypothetical protein